MNKQALEARAAALQTELDKLKAEIAKPELPAGYISFFPTEKNEPPCHPKSTVDFIRRDGEKLTDWLAGSVTWSKLGQYNEVAAYKVTKEYVEPRLMKYSELPVGQLFMWGYPSNSGPYSKTLYMKIEKEGWNAVLLKKEGRGLGAPGSLCNFNDSETKFYSAELTGCQGELLTVPSEKK
jgi:hypothetical protein